VDLQSAVNIFIQQILIGTQLTYKTIMQKVQLSNDDTSDFTDDPGYMFGFSVTVNPFNGEMYASVNQWETHCIFMTPQEVIT